MKIVYAIALMSLVFSGSDCLGYAESGFNTTMSYCSACTINECCCYSQGSQPFCDSVDDCIQNGGSCSGFEKMDPEEQQDVRIKILEDRIDRLEKVLRALSQR